MAEAGFDINNVAIHFNIHKTTAYRMINRLGKWDWLKTVHDRKDRKKCKSTGGTFHPYHIKAVENSASKPLCWTSRKCL